MVQEKIKNGQILESESLKIIKKKATKQGVSGAVGNRPQSQGPFSRQNQIKELFNTIYETKLTTVFDDVNQQLSDKYNEDALTKTNFYYFNINKNREEFSKDLRLQKQLHIAESHQMSNTHRVLSSLTSNHGTLPPGTLSSDAGLISAPLRSTGSSRRPSLGEICLMSHRLPLRQSPLKPHIPLNYANLPHLPKNAKRMSDLLKLKEEIELQNKAFKKVLLERKQEQHSERKDRMLIRRRAEGVRLGLARHGQGQVVEKEL